MKRSVKQGSNTFLRLIFWAVCFALIASLTIFILEKSHVTNLYKKPVNQKTAIINGPTNVIDYPINNGDGSSNSPDNKQSGTDKPNTSETLSGTINYKSVVGETLSVRATIYQIIDTGTCSLTLTRTSDNKTVSKTAEVAQNPSSSTCKGFDIPVSELGSGQWNIKVVVTDGGKTGEITDEVSL